MATIKQRGNKYYVIYLHQTEEGETKQKWESFNTLAEARIRKKEVEYLKEKQELVVKECITMNQLLDEYIELHGKVRWSMATYDRSVNSIKNYIRPALGKMKINEITTRHLEAFYQKLLKTPMVGCRYPKDKKSFVKTGAIREIHKILRNCFNQAVKWELLEKNPAINAMVPKHKPQKREIWTAETLFKAIDLCKDEGLKLCLQLSFACTLRSGEVLGLTWDCVDISEEAMKNGTPSIYIRKELQRVSKEAYENSDKKDVLFLFPESSKRTKTCLVLKTPKTESSIRRVFLPKSVAEMLAEYKKKQDEEKKLLGPEYHNYKLVVCTPFGTPREQSSIEEALKKLIRENALPDIVFHSIRHASITYKLKLNGGDVKAVQGDSGHSQSAMVTEVYSHILDENRKINAELFERAFYSGKGNSEESEQKTVPRQEADMGMIIKLLGNPEAVALMKQLIAAVESPKQ
jgi:integrase